MCSRYKTSKVTQLGLKLKPSDTTDLAIPNILWTYNTSITWKLDRNEESQASPETIESDSINLIGTQVMLH